MESFSHTQTELRESIKNETGQKNLSMVSKYNPNNPAIQQKLREAFMTLEYDTLSKML